MIPVPGDILDGAVETYRLEYALSNDFSRALRTALESALAAQDRHARAEIVQRIIWLAEKIDNDDDDDLATDGPAALLWFARAIQETLPQD